MSQVTDNFGRSFSYLRLSITDACNFRCTYCLPNGYQGKESEESYLSIDEIRRLVSGFSDLGFWKVRITGGEPTTRRDFLDVIETVSKINGIKKIALSTNGYKLKSIIKDLKNAGVSAVNVSVDSLDQKKFSEITGHDKLHEILSGIYSALDEGFEVKINAVLMRGINDVEIPQFLKLAIDNPIFVRFIELMGTGCNKLIFKTRHLPGETVSSLLENNGWSLAPRKPGDGPSQNYVHPDYLGKIGVIAPYSKDFCSTCNRLRVTSFGGLRLCLFSDGEISMRHLLQEDEDQEKLKNMISRVILRKEISHYLKDKNYGDAFNLSAMGG